MDPAYIVASLITLATRSQSMCSPEDRSGGHEMALEFAEIGAGETVFSPNTAPRDCAITPRSVPEL